MAHQIRMIFDPYMVLLSVLIAYVGSYLAIYLCEQYRMFVISHRIVDELGQHEFDDPSHHTEHADHASEPTTLHSTHSTNGEIAVGPHNRFLIGSKDGMEFVMLLSIACAVGGIGIWSMHFISMAALSLELHGEPVKIYFNEGLTIISLFSVVLFTLGGLYIAKNDPLFGKSQGQVLEVLLNNTTGSALRRKFSTVDVLKTLLTHEPYMLIAGGALTAVGIGIMHYVGMIGMYFDGIIHWYAGVIVFSVVLAIVVAIIAFWVLFRLLSTFHGSEPLRVVCALVFAVAKCSVHYTGMAAASYWVTSNPLSESLQFPKGHFSQNEAMTGALIATFFVSWCITMLIFSDLRHTNEMLHSQITTAENVLAKVKIDKRLVGATASIVNKYKFFKPNRAAVLAVTHTDNAVQLKEQQKAEEMRELQLANKQYSHGVHGSEHV